MTHKKPSSEQPIQFKRELVDPLGLLLDPNNPRLFGVADGVHDQDKLLRAVWDFGVLEIVTSIAASGYHNVEPLFAERQKDGSLVVIEGNRRLTALQVLLDPDRAARIGITGLPKIKPAFRAGCAQIPVAIGSRQDVWAFIGTKHLNGPKTWDSAAKAAYVQHVHERFGVSLEDIAETIGDRNRTVIRMYESMKIFEQAESWKVYRRADSGRKNGDTPFSHLYTIAGYDSARTFLGMADANSDQAMKRIRAPVGDKRKKELGQLLRWVYGHRGEGIVPLVESQNPDLRNLAKAISNDRGLAALRSGSSPLVASEIAEGDDVFVVEHLTKATEELELVSKKFSTGYTGQSNIAKMVEDIRDIIRGLMAQKVLKDQKDDL